MKRNIPTTASVFFTYGWARFMGTGFFAMEKRNRG